MENANTESQVDFSLIVLIRNGHEYFANKKRQSGTWYK